MYAAGCPWSRCYAMWRKDGEGRGRRECVRGDVVVIKVGVFLGRCKTMGGMGGEP